MTEKQPSTDPQAEGDPRSASASQPRITNTQKEKDPRKVAAGKKLGAISKMAKKQKKCEAEARKANEVNRGEAEAESVAEGEAENLENDNNFNTTTFYAGFAAVVVVGCLGVIYFTSIADASRKQQPHPEPQEVPEAPAGPKFKSNLISLDD